ncbi:MAG: hypothetical protein KatS3mg008_2203 [Acidimicrobiales bacterium]|nr:MAG: hypothetical protein KatS3mg008_2203 [Acidimicrobiales bacterium]
MTGAAGSARRRVVEVRESCDSAVVAVSVVVVVELDVSVDVVARRIPEVVLVVNGGGGWVVGGIVEVGAVVAVVDGVVVAVVEVVGLDVDVVELDVVDELVVVT